MNPRYYGVIGNRDHIKINGTRLPFWDFLDEQPGGWLSSLVYARKPDELPTSASPMIWDCGAWSYRNEDAPSVGAHRVTAQWAVTAYGLIARPGDYLVAPDHMLIPSLGDHAARRRFNTVNSRAFLRLAADDGRFVPMATVHGLTLTERVRQTRRYVDMGYQHLAIGGLAGQASRRQVCISAVAAVRDTFGGHLHVMGLSSPTYVAHWHHLGVDSYDGSSHFKQAFAGGAFFVADGARMLKFSAAHSGGVFVGPSCDCLACSRLREVGVDTRYFGSNEHNMGRAAHNMNQLMRAQQCAIKTLPIQLSLS